MNDFTISVPASTSNLGAGFDCLGLALDLRVRLSVRILPLGQPLLRRKPFTGTLAESPLAPPDRFERAMDAVARRVGRPLPPLEIEADSDTPVARGLGSSGAATVAGLVAAARVLEASLTADDLFDLGCALEGHPDNIGPALVGGCVLAMPDAQGRVSWFRAPVHPDLRVAVAWPATRVETARAREALPASVPFAVARDQARRLAQLLRGLEDLDPRRLRLGTEDALHTPYRAPLVPGCARVLAAALEAGALAAAISGSGSAIVALARAPEAERAAKAMRAAFEASGEKVQAIVSGVPGEGYRVEPLVRSAP